MQNYIGTAIVLISFALSCGDTSGHGNRQRRLNNLRHLRTASPHPVSTPVHMPTPDSTATPQLEPTSGGNLHASGDAPRPH